MNKIIKVIIFDLGRVLIPVDTHYLLGRASNLLGISQEKVRIAWSRDLSELTLGNLSVTDFYKNLAQECDVQLDMPAVQVVKELYTYFEDAQISEEMLSLIKMLQREYIVVVLSNAEVETGKIFSQGMIGSTVGHVYASSQLQMKKPDREIYEYVCNDLDVTPRECIFIDDIEENVIGAKKVGMHAVVFIDDKTLAQDLEKMNLLTLNS